VNIDFSKAFKFLSNLKPKYNKLDVVIIAHISAADLSVLQDFDCFKVNLDLMNKSLVTLKGPFVFKVEESSR